MVNIGYILAVVLLWVSTTQSACPCQYPDLQTKFCKSDFAFVGRITSSKPTTDGTSDIEYTAKVIRRIKGRIKVETFVFQSPRPNEDCGVEFPLNSIQFLMGKRLGLPIPSKKFNKITSCEVDPKERPLTPPQWTYVLSRATRNSYVRNCDCEVTSSRDKPGDFCRLVGDGKLRTCYIKNSLCTRIGFANRCGYTNTQPCGGPL